MNTIREIQRINESELERGIAGTPASWHSQYANSAWVYVGNLDHSLSEGDVICVLSQYGEIEDINLVRHEDTGKSKGFAFLKYEDSRSCVLAVDNLSGIKLCDRPLRIDHVETYRLPKEILEKEERAAAAAASGAGHAYEGRELENDFDIHKGQDLFARPGATDTHLSEKEKRKLEKAKRKRERERIRMEREERRRQRRAKHMKNASDDEGQAKDSEDKRRKNNKRKRRSHHSGDGKRSRKSKKDRRSI